MKLSFTILSATTATALAGCNSNEKADQLCEDYSGECSKAVELFLSGADRSAVTTLSYGKFCGAGKNRCPSKNNAADPAIAAKGVQKLIDIDPCGGNDTLDGGCEAHDRCLDNAGNDPGSDGIPTPDRCPCDLDFLFNLVGASEGCDGALCDADFYTEPVYPFDTPVLSWADFLSLGGAVPCPEAILLAAPFCSDFVVGGCADSNQLIDGEDLYTSDQKVVSLPAVKGFCLNILTAIGPLLQN